MLSRRILGCRTVTFRLWPAEHWFALQIGPDGSVWRWHWTTRERDLGRSAEPPGDGSAGAGVREPRRPSPSAGSVAAYSGR